MNSRIVAVTGASGVIGKVVVKKLIDRGYRVRALLRKESVSHWEDKNIEIIRGDINDPKILKQLMVGTWGIIHLAVEMDSALPWNIFEEVNINSVKKLLKLAPTSSRMVMTSSVVVYGDTGSVPRDEGWQLKERAGIDKYVKSKLMALKEVRNSKRKVISVMPSTVVNKDIFGKECFVSPNKLMGWVWNNIGGGIPGGLMAAVGSRKRVMNFVEVEDVSEGIILALEKGKLGEEYIISGENITTGDYLKMMSKKCGKSYLKIRIPGIILKMFGIGEVVNMCFSHQKATQELGYKPGWKL